MIGTTLALILSIEDDGTSLHKDPAGVNLATSYQFCPHLDGNNLKSTFLKNAFLHMCAYLKNWRVKFGKMLSIHQSLAPPKFRSIW